MPLRGSGMTVGLYPQARHEQVIDETQAVSLNSQPMPPTHSLKSLKGAIPKPKKPVSLKAMDRAIARGAKGK